MRLGVLNFELAAMSRTEKRVAAALRDFVLAPGTLILSTAFGIFIAVFTPAGILAAHPLWFRLLINGLDLILFLGLSYTAMPWFFILALRRGWPIYWTQSSCYLGLAVVLAGMLTYLDREALLLGQMLWYFLAIVFIVLLATVAGLAMALAFALPRAGVRIDPMRLWRFERATDCKLQDHLPADIRGPVLRLSSENQYIEAQTPRGSTHLRMPMATAEALLPEAAGLRIHRSHWLAHDQIGRLFFDNGNPRIETPTGAQYPVSRSKVDAVRDLLNRRDAGG